VAFGATDLANIVYGAPADGVSASDVERALVRVPGAGSAIPASAELDLVQSSLPEFTGIFRISEGRLYGAPGTGFGLLAGRRITDWLTSSV
jgi:hypothetical protein